jgi:hypothetical protein
MGCAAIMKYYFMVAVIVFSGCDLLALKPSAARGRRVVHHFRIGSPLMKMKLYQYNAEMLHNRFSHNTMTRLFRRYAMRTRGWPSWRWDGYFLDYDEYDIWNAIEPNTSAGNRRDRDDDTASRLRIYWRCAVKIDKISGIKCGRRGNGECE